MVGGGRSGRDGVVVAAGTQQRNTDLVRVGGGSRGRGGGRGEWRTRRGNLDGGFPS